jgi:hypothetical protein
MYGEQLRYHLLVALVIILLLLMMQLEKLWFIAFGKNMMFFYTFKKWKALVENETRKRLKCLISDNGGEYCNKEFDDYFSYHGIHRENTFPKTPQENGVS